jgi:hypothetical protein
VGDLPCLHVSHFEVVIVLSRQDTDVEIDVEVDGVMNDEITWNKGQDVRIMI